MKNSLRFIHPLIHINHCASLVVLLLPGSILLYDLQRPLSHGQGAITGLPFELAITFSYVVDCVGTRALEMSDTVRDRDFGWNG